MMENIDFNEVAKVLVDIGAMPSLPSDNAVKVNVPGSKDVLMRGLNWVTRGNATWLPEYNEVAEWLTDNKGRGLLMFGDCGRGKSLIGKYILPLIFKHWLKKIMNVYTAQALNSNIDEALGRHIIYVDDIGTEEVSVQYGNRRMAFAELVDAAESKGKLLVISTNLSLDNLGAKYGERTMDRLRAITRQILFEGDSLRK